MQGLEKTPRLIACTDHIPHAGGQGTIAIALLPYHTPVITQ